MTPEQVISIATPNNRIRIYFKDFEKSIVFGSIVMLDDAKDLISKGMFRFVLDYKMDFFNEHPDVKYTRIYQVSNIKEVIVF